MFFNDLVFVILFLPAVLTSFYWLVPCEKRRHFLLAASLGFYAVSGPAYLLLLLLDIAWIYAVTRADSYPNNRLKLWLAIDN